MTVKPTATAAMLDLESAECVRDLRLRSDGVSTMLVRVGADLYEAHCAQGAARELLAAEVVATERSRHPHMTRIVDCWSEGETLVVLRPSCRQTLDDILRTHPRMPPGVAVTVLAPIAAAIGACHENGVAGIALRPTDIAITDNGTPMLRGHAVAAETESVTPHWAAASAAVQADRAEFSALVEVLFEAPSTAVVEAVARGDWRQVSSELMTMAPPAPVGSLRDVSNAQDAAADQKQQRRIRQTMTRRMLRREERRGMLSRVSGVLTQSTASFLNGVRAIRPKFWIVGGAGVAAVLAAAVAVVQIPDSTAQDAVEPTVSATTAPTMSSAHPTTAPTQSPSAPSLAPADADEPLEAVAVLLEERERCLDEQADECLRAILMQGSLLYADDLAGEPQWRYAPGSALELQQELGDAVIVSVAHEEQPASVLAVNTEAGWLLREVWVD